jgi:hypothetical protein
VLALGSAGEDGEAVGQVSAAAVPPGFLGLVAEDVFGHPGRYRRRGLSGIDAAGVGLIRQTFDWAMIERRPGRYDFRFHDGFVRDLARRGIRVLPILFNPPRFRSSRPPRGGRRGVYPPRDYAALGVFGARLARRYGPGGTFWRRHPDLPQLPFQAWQVWNEPNIPFYWPSGPSASAYTRLLRATADRIRAVDSEAEIVTAGLPNTSLRTAVPLRRYLNGMYRAGAAQAFDTLAVNGFAPTAAGLLANVRLALGVASAHGDRPAVRVTEFGWSTGGPASDYRVSNARQARLIRRTLLALARRRGSMRIRGVVYFNWRDSRPFLGGHDFFGLHTGLRRRSGKPKPSYSAYQNVAKTLGVLPH